MIQPAGVAPVKYNLVHSLKSIHCATCTNLIQSPAEIQLFDSDEQGARNMITAADRKHREMVPDCIEPVLTIEFAQVFHPARIQAEESLIIQ